MQQSRNGRERETAAAKLIVQFTDAAHLASASSPFPRLFSSRSRSAECCFSSATMKAVLSFSFSLSQREMRLVLLKLFSCRRRRTSPPLDQSVGRSVHPVPAHIATLLPPAVGRASVRSARSGHCRLFHVMCAPPLSRDVAEVEREVRREHAKNFAHKPNSFLFQMLSRRLDDASLHFLLLWRI